MAGAEPLLLPTEPDVPSSPEWLPGQIYVEVLDEPSSRDAIGGLNNQGVFLSNGGNLVDAFDVWGIQCPNRITTFQFLLTVAVLRWANKLLNLHRS